MKLTIVVDANPIISALIGGTAREIFFKRSFNFATTNFTITEVRKFLPYIYEKSGVPLKELEEALSLLPIKIYRSNFYSRFIEKAKGDIGKIDAKDVDILALALRLSSPLWSNDEHFHKVRGVTLLKTKDLV